MPVKRTTKKYTTRAIRQNIERDDPKTRRKIKKMYMEIGARTVGELEAADRQGLSKKAIKSKLLSGVMRDIKSMDNRLAGKTTRGEVREKRKAPLMPLGDFNRELTAQWGTKSNPINGGITLAERRSLLSDMSKIYKEDNPGIFEKTNKPKKVQEFKMSIKKPKTPKHATPKKAKKKPLVIIPKKKVVSESDSGEEYLAPISKRDYKGR